jgi:hypothetical protein
MGIAAVKLDDIDVRYLTIINDTMQQIENKILALELTKFEVYEELKKIKARYKEYSGQLKDKYGIPATEAEIDLEEKVIKFVELEVKEPVNDEKQSGGTKKAKSVPKVPKPQTNKEPSE